MSRLRIELFGKPQITHGDRNVDFRTRKALALLVYLVVEGGTHTREKLSTLLWPESDPDAGRATLRSTLRYLRRPLQHPPGGDAISHLKVARDALAFNFDSDYELDLDSVQKAMSSQGDDRPVDSESLQQAVSAYRGHFLEGFSLPDAPGFDDWMRLQAERWHLRLSQLFERLSQRQAEGGATSEAIETTARWTAFQPLKEAAYRRLMRLQLAEGDRAAALQTYQKCRQTLAEELGVEPAPETRALGQRIAADASPGQAPKGGTGTGQKAEELSPSLLQSRFPFVGRRDQHTQLVEAFYRSESERAQVAVIEGEAGIGKTRLAQELLGWAAAQGAKILPGRAFETGGRLPYQPVAEALRPLVPGLQRLLTPTWLGELTRLLPELNDQISDLPVPTTDETVGRSRLFEAVARFGIELASHAPLVLFVDDLQWADAATLDLLSYAARRWSEEEVPILLLGAVRAEALHRAVSSDAFLEWLGTLERELGLMRLELGALSQGEIGRLVERVAHSDEEPSKIEAFAKWLFRETRGQPFYVIETIKALLEDETLVSRTGPSGQARIALSARVAGAGSWDEADPLKGFVPPGVRDVVRDRLARLRPAEFELVAAGAILGQDFDFRSLCQVAGLSRSEALSILDRLLGTRLLAESKQADRPYTFAHDKIRDVVYTEAGDARRQLFHERALEYLRGTQAPAAQLAHHAHRAGDYAAAFRHSLQAGEDAMDVFAVRDALLHFENARRALLENHRLGNDMESGRRRHLYESLGRGYELVNDWASAQEVYEEMLADARDLEWPEMEVAALNRLAAIEILWQLDPNAALSILEEARTVAQATGDRRGLAEAEWGSCLSKFYAFQRPAALEHGKRAITLARGVGDRELIAKCLNASGYAASGVNLWRKVEEYGDEAHSLYAELGNRALEADSLLLVAFARITVGETESGVEIARKALRISRQIENEWGVANSLNHLAAGLLDLGAYGEAFNTVQGVFGLSQLKDAPQYMAAFTVRGLAYWAFQDFKKALSDHRNAEAHIHRLGNPSMPRVLSAHLCADYASLGQWDKAYEQAQIAMETKDFGWYYAGFHYWTVIEALLHGGDEAAADKDIMALAEAVERFPRYRIVVERCKALLKKWQGDTEEAINHLEIALQKAEELSLPGERWLLLVELGELRQAVGREKAAQRALSRAANIVRHLAGTIDDEELRDGFLSSHTVESLLRYQ